MVENEQIKTDMKKYNWEVCNAKKESPKIATKFKAIVAYQISLVDGSTAKRVDKTHVLLIRDECPLSFQINFVYSNLYFKY